MNRIGKPVVLKTTEGTIFWMYPEFLMERPFVNLMGNTTARLVERKHIAVAFLSPNRIPVPVIGGNHNNSYLAGNSYRRGRFRIGCKHFAAPETKIIRKWALR